MGDTRRISEGLNLMYVGNIIAIAASLCTLLALLVPFLVLMTGIAILVGGVICLVGLAKLRNEHGDYMNALVACILGIIFGLLSNNESVFGSMMDLAQSICSLIQIYFVIRGTNNFLRIRGYLTEESMGDRAWKWELISVVVSVATAVLAFVLLPLAFILAIVNMVVSIAALVFYLSYLKASAGALS
jgi:hypothetical protein